MRNTEERKTGTAVFLAIGAVAVLWLSLLLAPCLGGGLPQMIPKLGDALSHPFRLSFCGASVPTALILLAVYGLVILVCHYTKPNYRRREEHGSAHWGKIADIDRKYRQEPPESNKILTQHIAIGYDTHSHRRNLNTLVVGGSGAGKTRFYAKPNLMQANTSFVVTDPKGELLRDTGYLLESAGYKVRVLDLLHMRRSHGYNPFVYLQSDNDVQRLVTNLFKATTPKGSQTNDPFWDTAASMLLLALMYYLWYEAPKYEQNFGMVMELLRAGDIPDEENANAMPSTLDELFAELESKNPYHIAVKYYKAYRSGSAKTLKSVQITLAARLEKFNLDSLASFHRQFTNSFVEFLSVSACFYRIHHNIFSRHEWQFCHHMFFDYLRIYHQTVYHIQAQIQNTINCQKTFRNGQTLVCGIIQCSFKPLSCRCDCRIQGITQYISGQGSDSLTSHRISLISHSRGSDLCLFKWFFYLPECSVLWYPLFWNRSVRIPDNMLQIPSSLQSSDQSCQWSHDLLQTVPGSLPVFL